MKKIKMLFSRIILSLLSLTILLAIIVLFIIRNDIKTLSTLTKIDDYGIYKMYYYSDYHFDKLLEDSPASTEELTKFIKKNVFHNLPLTLQDKPHSCSAFITKNEKGEILFCRNMEIEEYMPGVALYTTPNDGYASVSMCDLLDLNYDKTNLPTKDGISLKSIPMLATPFLVKDGMNEHGVAIAMLRTTYQGSTDTEGAPLLDMECIMRYVLDNAKNIDEAIALIEHCNVKTFGYFFHLFLADRSGRSVAIEWYDKKPHYIETNVLTNIDVHYGLDTITAARFVLIRQALSENNNVMTVDQALDTLNAASMGINMSQWSIVYNLTTGEINFFAGGQRDNVKSLSLPIKP